MENSSVIRHFAEFNVTVDGQEENAPDVGQLQQDEEGDAEHHGVDVAGVLVRKHLSGVVSPIQLKLI